MSRIQLSPPLKLIGFVDSGRRYNTPGSEIMDFFTPNTENYQSISVMC